jgi:hypothetical protein
MTYTTQPDIAEPSLQDVRDAIGILFCPGQVVELRSFGVRGAAAKKFVLSGYYDDPCKMAADAVRMSATSGVTGTFWTIQEINPALLAHSPNRYREARAATTDGDVTGYAWLPIDFDPVRASGTSSTDEEKAAANGLMIRVSSFLKDSGIATLRADSGNGFHLLARIALPVEDGPLVARFLAALDEQFSNELVKVDRTLFNPSRILKSYGTTARKGPSTGERPHRVARLLEIPDVVVPCVSRELLEKIAATASRQPTKKKPRAEKAAIGDLELALKTMERFLAEGKIEYGACMEYRGGFKWQLAACPFNPDHRTPDSIITLADTGAMGFSCSHNSCSDKTWKEFKRYVQEITGHTFEFFSDRDFANISLIYRITHSKDPARLEAEFQKRFPTKYESRNHIKGMHGEKTFIRYSIEHFLRGKNG